MQGNQMSEKDNSLKIKHIISDDAQSQTVEFACESRVILSVLPEVSAFHLFHLQLPIGCFNVPSASATNATSLTLYDRSEHQSLITSLCYLEDNRLVTLSIHTRAIIPALSLQRLMYANKQKLTHMSVLLEQRRLTFALYTTLRLDVPLEKHPFIRNTSRCKFVTDNPCLGRRGSSRTPCATQTRWQEGRVGKYIASSNQYYGFDSSQLWVPSAMGT